MNGDKNWFSKDNFNKQSDREKEFGWWLPSLVFVSLDYIVSNVGWGVYLKACPSNVYI